MKNLYESTETANYIVQYSEEKQRWELRGKLGNKTYFMSCKFQTPLLVAQRELEIAYDDLTALDWSQLNLL